LAQGIGSSELRSLGELAKRLAERIHALIC